LVQILSPYTRVIKAEDEASPAAEAKPTAADAVAEAAAPKKRGPVRIKRAEAGDAPV
jgi:hypothetical protein